MLIIKILTQFYKSLTQYNFFDCVRVFELYKNSKKVIKSMFFIFFIQDRLFVLEEYLFVLE